MAWHGVVYAQYYSFLSRNAQFFCKLFGWSVDDFVLNNIKPTNAFFQQYSAGGLTQENIGPVRAVFELLCLRENYSVFIPDASFLQEMTLSC